MKRKQLVLQLICLAALLVLTVSQSMGEMLRTRVSRGNNVGLNVVLNWGGPIKSIQFPAGSGNAITNSSWGMGLGCVRDLDGDGLSGDTIIQGNGGSTCEGKYSSVEARSLIESLVAAGVPNVGSEMTKPENSRVWSSLDADDLASWPLEFREGRDLSGEPVLHGAESMCWHMSTVFESYSDFPSGVYYGWQAYFLDFAESNNMVYFHVDIANVSEYMQYNQNSGFREIGSRFPSGWNIDAMILGFYTRSIKFGGGNSGWAYHPAKNIVGYYSLSPTSSSYTPPEPPLMGWKMLNRPVFNGQESEVLTCHADIRGAEYGVTSLPGAIAGSLRHPDKYRTMMGTYEMISGLINPWTGRSGIRSYPGKIEESDQRYNQWLWGGYAGYGISEYFGEIMDFAPRDTTSCDWVLMLAEPGVKPLVHPQFDLANLDDQSMQDALAPLEHYAEVAEKVQEGGYILPESPKAPPLTIIPGDRQVTLTWSDVNIDTPDAYYTWLEENGFNPDGHYQEYDFQGYRVYRSFVGPNDSHAELLADLNQSDGNIKFHYIDKLEDDLAYRRMRNGARIWYAVVPYDTNYDAVSGEAFSLPDPAGSKAWNRPGEILYQVIPRSEANNFKAAGLDGEIEFVPAYGSPSFESSVTLDVGANGLLAEAPRYLAPVADFEFSTIIAERITSPKTINLTVNGNHEVRAAGSDRVAGYLKFQLQEDGGADGMETGEYPTRVYGGSSTNNMVLSGAVDDAGADYAIDAEFRYLSNGAFRTKVLAAIDLGSYTGARALWESRLRNGGDNSSDSGTYFQRRYGPGGYPPAHPGMIRAGRYTLTWKDAGGGMLTLEVMDVTRNAALPFTEFLDVYGWGFVTPEIYGSHWSRNDRGQPFNDARNHVPQAERTARFVDRLPADYTDEFGIYINGMQWTFVGQDQLIHEIGGMPSSGAVFTVDNAYGNWSGDKSQFTQEPDPPWSGDKWVIRVSPTTMNPDDADLSKIRVVPNPYLASSFLDFSPVNRRIEFVNLPANCTIRIYSLGGNLVNVLNHIGASRQGWGNYTDWDRLSLGEPEKYEGFDNHGGTEPWNLRNRYGQTVASGLYFYHVTDERGEDYTGKFYIIN